MSDDIGGVDRSYVEICNVSLFCSFGSISASASTSRNVLKSDDIFPPALEKAFDQYC